MATMKTEPTIKLESVALVQRNYSEKKQKEEYAREIAERNRRARTYSSQVERKRELKARVACALMILVTLLIMAYGMYKSPIYDRFPIKAATPTETENKTETENISCPDENYIYIICGVESNDNGNLVVHMPNGELHTFKISDPPLGEIETVTLRATRENEENYNMYTVVAVD